MINIPPSRWGYAINHQEQIIGRSPEADIPLPNEFADVSRRHAAVCCIDGRLQLRDLNSTHGTRVNGILLPPARNFRIEAGDRISLASVELSIITAPWFSAQPDDLCTVADAQTRPDSDPAPRLADRALTTLTPRERDVVMWMTRGIVDDADIARVLYRSPHTVRTQIGSILRKLGLHSRAELVALPRRLRRQACPTDQPATEPRVSSTT